MRLLGFALLCACTTAAPISGVVQPSAPGKGDSPGLGADGGIGSDSGSGDDDAANVEPSDGGQTDAHPDADVTPAPGCTLACGQNERCVLRNQYNQSGQVIGTVPRCWCAVDYWRQNGVCVLAPPRGPGCTNVTCSGHGHCVAEFNGFYECKCDAGYVEYNTYDCVAETKVGCRDRDGSYKYRGAIRCDAADKALEVCTGAGTLTWVASASCGASCAASCLPNVGASNCPTGTAPVTSIHGQSVSDCYPTCDCTNCDNCKDFVNYDMFGTLACGNSGGRPSTVCNKPCPSGYGCIPWGGYTGICYPSEGCGSAPPL